MSLLFLAAALALLRLAPVQGEPIVAAALLAALTAGLTLPDVDQVVPLSHRSVVTHSVFPAALLMVRRWAWPVAAGLALGLSMHLAADFFPRAMIGYATIKVPLSGSLDATASYAWIGVSAGVALALGLVVGARILPPGQLRLPTAAAAAAIGGAYLLTTNGGWSALLLIVGGGLLLLRFGLRHRRAL